jgi:fatty acid desaturase
VKRDYRVGGDEYQRAIARGLESAAWYRSPIPRARMKELVRRHDRRALVDTAIWLIALAVSGVAASLSWGTWWALPAFFVYGTLYGSVSDSRWHECGHGTAFATPWMNTAVYHLASFMGLREPISWRWSHARHHSDTIIVGLDPEIAVPRPTPRLRIVADLFGIVSHGAELRKMLANSVGRVTAQEATYLPAGERPAAIRWARIHLAVLVATIAASIALGSILPLLFVGLPSFYGRWLLVVFGLTQHAGLAEDVLDHRLNTRTVEMNPVLRFMYWNMNYHVEHHMFPNVPFHALADLHREIRDDLPPAYPGLLAAYREIVPALWRQASDPAYVVVRPVPGSSGRVEGAAV